MSSSIAYLVYMTLVTWLAVMLASLFRARAWTPGGLGLAMGNRADMPAPSPAAARLDRAAKNTFENLVFFAALVFAAYALSAPEARVRQGAAIFFWSRLIYIPVYWAGIAYVRTVVWAVSIVGLGMIVAALP